MWHFPLLGHLWLLAEISRREWAWIIIGALLLLTLVVLLGAAIRHSESATIRRLGPSFFFWLSMGYLAVLLAAAVIYYKGDFGLQELLPPLIGNVMPLAVPWFGALGAALISLQGVFLHNQQWETKYNYWHIARPIFGAVLGMMAFFFLVLINLLSGSPPPFIENPTDINQKDLIIYYVLAFLVGYREETFGELIKRVTDMILQPGGPPSANPAIIFRVNNRIATVVAFGNVNVNAAGQQTVQIENAGTDALLDPVIDVQTTPPANNAFQITGDDDPGGVQLAPGALRTITIAFRPPAAGAFSGVLSVRGSNLTTARTIRLTGTGQ